MGAWPRPVRCRRIGRGGRRERTSLPSRTGLPATRPRGLALPRRRATLTSGLLDRVAGRRCRLLATALRRGLALLLPVVPATTGVGINLPGATTEARETTGSVRRERRANTQSTDLVTIVVLHILQNETTLQIVLLVIVIQMLARGTTRCLSLPELCCSPSCPNQGLVTSSLALPLVLR